MGSLSLPSPPAEDHKSSSRKSSTHSKSSKLAAQRAKRSNSHNIAHHALHHETSSAHSQDGRHKRVWKACERCRMKKTKCDGEFPCKRCKDDGLVCTAGVRKKTEYKQLPRGYAEVLENTQFALVATVHKLYAMVRNQQQWDLGEPELNDRGLPIVHNIAQKLGCIRPNSDLDLPVHSIFPEDEAGMAELASQLEDHQRDADRIGIKEEMESLSSHSHSPSTRMERDSSSEGDHSDFEADYRPSGFTGLGMTVSPQTIGPYGGSTGDFDSQGSLDPVTTAAMFLPHPAMSPAFAPAWKPSNAIQLAQYLQQSNALGNMDLLNQGLLESEFGRLKPHVMSCPNPEVMMGMGDPMIYSGYDGESMRL